MCVLRNSDCFHGLLNDLFTVYVCAGRVLELAVPLGGFIVKQTGFDIKFPVVSTQLIWARRVQ